MARPNTNGGHKTDKLWRDALRRAIARRQESDPQALEKLADHLIEMAFGSDAMALGALKELGDRLDGKPKQQLDLEPGEVMSRLIVQWAQKKANGHANGHDTLHAPASV